MRAIQVSVCGSPEVMKVADLPVPVPGPAQALVKIAASGVNYIDVYFRSGLYKADVPMPLGMEGAGTVEAVGEGVTALKAGDRVAYAMSRGSYSEYAVVPAWQLVPVPDGVTLETAAASMLQGMTAHYLTHSTFPLSAGQTALVHAAAGGAGLLIVQMAKARGARVIGTVSTEAKAASARRAGCDEVILYTQQDFEVESRRLTDGKGVDVIYDSVGATTFLKGLNSIRPRGMMVLFGQSSGPVAPVDLNILNPKGSLYVTRPSLAHYAANREEVLWRAGEVLDGVRSGAISIHVDKTYTLQEAPQAHRDLEGRKSSGKLLLVPA
ncbi:MAG: quinone oxidoreductase family protein [Bryobacteraceae bacterium]